MAYTNINFKTKKEIKEALAAGKHVSCYNPGLGGDLSHHSGFVSLEGPHYPKPHKWYAQGFMDDGRLISIK